MLAGMQKIMGGDFTCKKWLLYSGWLQVENVALTLRKSLILQFNLC
jgi:hypothetical protein